VKITGSVPDWASLPTTGAVGDAYIVRATGHLAVWDTSGYIDTGPIQGPPGGLAGYQIVVGAAVQVASDDENVSATATCAAGKVAIAGGMRLADEPSSDYLTGIRLVQSYPTVDGATYRLACDRRKRLLGGQHSLRIRDLRNTSRLTFSAFSDIRRIGGRRLARRPPRAADSAAPTRRGAAQRASVDGALIAFVAAACSSLQGILFVLYTGIGDEQRDQRK
jgi:hypothetical protein